MKLLILLMQLIACTVASYTIMVYEYSLNCNYNWSKIGVQILATLGCYAFYRFTSYITESINRRIDKDFLYNLDMATSNMQNIGFMFLAFLVGLTIYILTGNTDNTYEATISLVVLYVPNLLWIWRFRPFREANEEL